MNSVATILEDQDHLVVSGDLNYSNVNQLWQDSLPFITKHAVLQFDLSKINSANSAAIALLLEWKKYAASQKKSITFSQMPEQLKLVAAVAGVEKFL